MQYNNFKKITLLFIFLSLILTSCEKFLDVKPEKALAIPETLSDLESMLNNTIRLNIYGPCSHEVASDDHYLTSENWNSIPTLRDKDSYIWEPYVLIQSDYNSSYLSIGLCNEVLSNLKRIELDEFNRFRWSRIKATALFFRSFHLYQLAQVFAAPYNSPASLQAYGLPIPESSGFEQTVIRRTVNETYQFIINDLREALKDLPDQVNFKTQPTLAAGNALIARVYLNMQEYDLAIMHADAAVNLKSNLLDYNKLNGNVAIPFKRFNDEVIFHSTMNYSSSLLAPISKIDTVLYASYDTSDLRKSHFFMMNTDGTFSFKGNYDGVINDNLFSGLTTAELYLILAEGYARKNDLVKASGSLNALLSHRIKIGAFTPLAFSSQNEAIDKILLERRKELIYRGQRWGDLRRLNMENGREILIKRFLNNTIYELKPNDLRYMFLLPENVISFNPGMQQNPR